MRLSFSYTPHNAYAATNAKEALQFASRETIVKDQMVMNGGYKSWYPLAPDPGVAKDMQPERIYGRDGIFRDYELGMASYTSNYVSPLIYMLPQVASNK